MPEETQSTTTSTSAEPSSQGSYVQSILGTAGEFGADEAPRSDPQPQQAEVTAPGTTPDKPETTQVADKADTTGTTPELEALIQQFAKEHDLDPQDPNQRRLLKRLADKELYIQQLKAGKTTADTPVAAADTTGPDLMTAFEKELATEKPAEAVGDKPQDGQGGATAVSDSGKTATAAAESKYGDVGDEWKTPEDSLGALNTAWADNNLKQVHEIEMARLRRNFDSGIAPQLLKFVERMVESRLKGFAEKDLGDIVPEVRRNVSERRMTESREFAIDELRKAGATEIEKIFEVQDGPPLSFEGQEFPNTPLNRILVKHPEIMRIVEAHSDPAKAERKTLISRYKLAYQIFRQSAAGAGVSAETARKLVDAGRESRTRDASDRARQSINAGPGATGRGGQPSKSYVNDLNNLPGEVPFASLL